MSWSKVNKPLKKPLLWWFHKVLCEVGYFIYRKINPLYGLRMYYKHLNKLCSTGYNLYGEEFKTNKRK